MLSNITEILLLISVRKYLSVKIRIIQKPVKWFATQIISLVSIWYEFLLKDISEQTTNFRIVVFCKDQKVLALVLPVIKKSDNDTKIFVLPVHFLSRGPWQINAKCRGFRLNQKSKISWKVYFDTWLVLLT